MYDVNNCHVDCEDSRAQIEFDFVSYAGETENRYTQDEANDIEWYTPLNLGTVAVQDALTERNVWNTFVI